MNIQFQFQSIDELFHMSGHGPYVWAAYAITVAGLLFLLFQVRLKKKSIAQRIHVAQLKATHVEPQNVAPQTGD